MAEAPWLRRRFPAFRFLRPRAALAAALLAVLAGACASPSDEAVRWTARDSAGVEIIRSRGPAPVWAVDEEPVLELGSAEQPGLTLFYRVRDVELLPGASLVVANQGSEELLLFAPDGTLRGRVGGKGHGPREFDGLAMVEVRGDSLLTWDGGNQRLSVRRLDGTLARTFQLEWRDGILFPVDLHDDRLLTVTARSMVQLRGSGLVIDTALVSLHDMEGDLVDSLARVPHNARVVMRAGERQTTVGAPYVVGASLVAHDGGFCHTFGPDPEIRCRDRDALRRVIRVDVPVRPVAAADVDLWWRESLATTSERRRSALLRVRDVMPFPAAFPAFSQLLRDDEGRLWARRFTAPGDADDEWLVFDDGRWVARLRTPAAYRVMDVRSDRLAGVWRDTLGVEYVRVYRFRPRGPDR